MSSVIFDHPDFLVVNKSINVTMHASSASPNPAILSEPWAQQAHLHLVHRLDDGTSGCLVLAKHADAAKQFTRMFASGDIRKTYLALSLHKGKRKMGWVKGDMHKRRHGQWLLQSSNTDPAVSYFIRKSAPAQLRAFWVRPFTGKTHQIRVALKSNSAAILGDVTYGGEIADRVYLHAYALAFSWHSEPIHITCPPDQGEHFVPPEALACWSEQYHGISQQWPG